MPGVVRRVLARGATGHLEAIATEEAGSFKGYMEVGKTEWHANCAFPPGAKLPSKASEGLTGKSPPVLPTLLWISFHNCTRKRPSNEAIQSSRCRSSDPGLSRYWDIGS